MTADNVLKGRALITGAAGFIGRRLCSALVERGVEVHTLDLAVCAIPGSERAHVADIRDAAAVNDVVATVRPHAVFHLAAFKERRSDPEAFERAQAVNVGGTLALLDAVRGREELRAFVSAGTCEEYGAGPTPFLESQREAPVSAYSWSKAAATHLCQTFARDHGIPAVVLRPTVAYGPGQPEDMFLSALVGALLRGDRFPMTAGEQTRDFVYVDDIVTALLAAGAAGPLVAGRVINVGSGSATRICDVVALLERLMGADGVVELGAMPYRTGEAMTYVADVALARELLGWEAATTLEDGLTSTIDAARAGA